MNRPVSIYLTGLTCAFWAVVAALIVFGRFDPVGNWRAWLPLLAVAMLIEVFEVAAGDRGDASLLSLSGAAHVAAVILFGPIVAALIAAVAVLLADGVRSWSPKLVLANAALFGWASLLGGVAYEAAGGTVGALSASSAVAVVALVVTRGFANAVLFSLGDALASRTKLGRAVQSTLAEGAGTYLGEGSMGVLVAAGWNARQWVILPFLVPLFAGLYGARSNLERLRRETGDALTAFARVIDERDPHTARHTERVATYVERFVEAINLSPREARRLVEAARYHDLGKVAVDHATLTKAERLDEEEIRAIRRHPRLSATLLAPFGFARDMARMVEMHHERYDGRGYYSVAGADVSLETHVLIVADSFDAMTSERAYRPALSLDEAAQELLDKAGTQFHPQIARVFAAMVHGQPVEEAVGVEGLAALRAGFGRVPTLPRLPVGWWSDWPSASVAGLAGFLIAVALAPTVVALVGLLVLVGPTLMVSTIRKRRSRRGMELAASGDVGAALGAMRAEGRLVWLRWDPRRDAYQTSASDPDATEVCRSALLATADPVLRLRTGAYACLSASTADRSRLAVISARPPKRRDPRLVQLIAKATPTRRPSVKPDAERSGAVGQRGDTALVIALQVFERVRIGSGQLAAERAVAAAADAVATTLREGDRVMQLGEDQLLVWTGATSADDLAAIYERIARSLGVVQLPARLAPIEPWIGVASSPTFPVDLSARAILAQTTPIRIDGRATQ